MIQLTDAPIDSAAILAAVNSPSAGAVVLFLGTARQWTGERETLRLDYECYPDMARQKLEELEAEARRRWPLVECALVHRVGRIELGEASVAVAVSAPHRDAAFEAGKWLIDTLKEVVPIWKQEHWADGATEWVHPGAENPLPSRERVAEGRVRGM
jgi:molybdopterin synthase catalytic subunit